MNICRGVDIAYEPFEVRGQKSRSYVYICVKAIMAEVNISTVWHEAHMLSVIIIVAVTSVCSLLHRSM